MHDIKTTLRRPLILAVIFTFALLRSFAQAPTHLPRRNPEPTTFTDNTVNVVFFIIIPLVIAIIYFYWRRRTGR